MKAASIDTRLSDINYPNPFLFWNKFHYINFAIPYIFFASIFRGSDQMYAIGGSELNVIIHKIGSSLKNTRP